MPLFSPQFTSSLALLFPCFIPLLFLYGASSSLSFTQLPLTQASISMHTDTTTHTLYLHLCSYPLAYYCSTKLTHISLPQTIHLFPPHTCLTLLPSQPFSRCPSVNPFLCFLLPSSCPSPSTSHSSFLLPHSAYLSVCLSFLPTVLSHAPQPISLPFFPSFPYFVSLCLLHNPAHACSLPY